MNITIKRCLSTAAICALAFAAAACDRAEAPAESALETAAAISEADAAAIADATVATWTSMDTAKIKALYAPGVLAFDFSAPDLVTERARFDEIQDGFAAAKFDAAEELSRNIQILDAGNFVMNGAWNITSSATPANNASVRCTDVFHKDDGGKWLIVSEHCSPVPSAA